MIISRSRSAEHLKLWQSAAVRNVACRYQTCHACMHSFSIAVPNMTNVKINNGQRPMLTLRLLPSTWNLGVSPNMTL